MAITIASRPASLDGCWQNWSERDAPAVLRSEMEMGGFTKTRLRTTAAAWLVEASVTLDSALYDDVQRWFRQDCILGSLPTRVKRPNGAEVVVRFTAPPTITFPQAEPGAMVVAATFERLPAWASL